MAQSVRTLTSCRDCSFEFSWNMIPSGIFHSITTLKTYLFQIHNVKEFCYFRVSIKKKNKYHLAGASFGTNLKISMSVLLLLVCFQASKKTEEQSRMDNQEALATICTMYRTNEKHRKTYTHTRAHITEKNQKDVQHGCATRTSPINHDESSCSWRVCI